MIPLAPLHHNKQLQVSLEWTELFPLFFLAQVIQAANGYKSWQVRLPFLFLGTKLLALSEFSNLPISWNLSLSQCHVCSIIFSGCETMEPDQLQIGEKNSHLNQIWRHKTCSLTQKQSGESAGRYGFSSGQGHSHWSSKIFHGCSKITVIWDGYGPTSKWPNPNKIKATAWS